MNQTAPVTVTPVPLTRSVYDAILRALDTEAYEYGKHSDLDDARRYLHYRWLVEQSEAKPVDVTQKSV